jgi:hypothetical protein
MIFDLIKKCVEKMNAGILFQKLSDAQIADIHEYIEYRNNRPDVMWSATSDLDFPEEMTCQPCVEFSAVAVPCPKSGPLEDLMANLDAGFSETLLKLIDRSGKKDSEIYKKANVDRRLFSKIRSNPDYKPSKATALAFAIALELTLWETEELIARAGFALSHSSKFDIIIEYFIENEIFDIHQINAALYEFDQSLLGGQ